MAKRLVVHAIDRVRIVAAREAKGLSQQELAQQVGTTRQTIYRLEKGLSPTSEWLRKVYSKLDLKQSLIGKYEDDVEQALQAYYALRSLEPKTAGRRLQRLQDAANKAKVLSDRQRDLDAERQRLLEDDDRVDATDDDS
jgi:DNA-binding XRE family transcriptional regulator